MHPPRHIAVVLAMLAQVVLPNVSFGADPFCSRKSVAWPLHWISSIEVDEQKNQIFIVDPKATSLISYRPSTGKFVAVPVDKGSTPTSITKIQGGFLLKDRDDVTFLDPDWRPLGKANLRLTKSGSQSGLGSLYSNWVTRGSRFVGFGSVASTSGADLGHLQFNPARGFQLGFVTGRISANSDQIRDIKLLEAAEDNAFYLLGFPYFAANDVGLFYVRMLGASASLVRVRELPSGDVKLEQLSVFAKGFKEIPDLRKIRDEKASVSERFAEIEKSKMVAGLYGQGKFLYLLTREPNPNGEGVQWLVHQIDPDKSALLGVVRLPTTSNYLSIAPAPNDWYIFERKEVRGWGDQNIDTVLRVPVSWISSPSSRLNAERHEKVECISDHLTALHLSVLQ